MIFRMDVFEQAASLHRFKLQVYVCKCKIFQNYLLTTRLLPVHTIQDISASDFCLSVKSNYFLVQFLSLLFYKEANF